MKQLAVVALSLLFLTAANAEPIRIVAFGGSNTFGKNLSRSAAYPAQLEAMLRSKGYDVVVVNEGTNGQTTADEVERLSSAIPSDTKIVIFQPGGNDRRKNADKDTKANIELILRRLLDRNILVLFSGGERKRAIAEKLKIPTIDEINQLAPNDLQPDGQHLTERGYRLAAERMLPVVEKLIVQTKSK